MYIKSLSVRNVRLLAEQEFSFVNADRSPRMWTVIVGENGVCKSTILQVIALAAMGPKLGSALAQDAQRLRNIRNQEHSFIGAEFSLRGRYLGATILPGLKILPERHDLVPESFEPYLSSAELLDDTRARRSPDLFIAGYGVGRFLSEPGETVLPKDPTMDRVRGLFTPRHRMLGLNFYHAFSRKPLARRFARYLQQALIIGGSHGERLLPGFHDLDLDGYSDDENSSLEVSSVELRIDQQRLRLPAAWLSDGYQAMLSWVADLLGHAFLELEDKVEPQELTGIVLLDEIDLHLHPTWQRRIVPLLRQTFPKLQFIVNTHSPLVLAGFEREEIILLKMEDGQVVQDPAEIEPGILTASEILSNFFEVPRAGRPDLVQKERRYLELQAKTRLTPGEKAELTSLKGELDQYIIPSTEAETEMLSPDEILNRKT